MSEREILRHEPEVTDPIVVRLEEAAAMLSVSVKWIRAHRASLPWVRELSPRVLRADVAAMRRWVERRKA